MLSAAAISPAHRASTGVDPRAAMFLLVLTVAALLLLPADLRLLLPAAGIGAIALGAGQGKALLRRLRLLLPMLLFFTAFVAFRAASGTELLSFAGLTLTRGGLSTAAELVLRLTLLAAASLLFSLRVPQQQFVAALAALRLPSRVTAVLWLAERMLVLLGEDIRRMLECLRARSGTLSRSARIRAAARIGGTFLLRAVGRSERLADAMSARAFTGRIPVLRTLQWRTRDTALCAGSTVFFSLLWIL
ncbi:MAG: energy-coupling factor transporter transmembrane component T [Bacteroidota bacterium]|nr:energy-coupling factor transporter transmembrane component T [Bacteroidota bacterium]